MSQCETDSSFWLADMPCVIKPYPMIFEAVSLYGHVVSGNIASVTYHHMVLVGSIETHNEMV